jgi:hypothetical protein
MVNGGDAMVGPLCGAMVTFKSHEAKTWEDPCTVSCLRDQGHAGVHQAGVEALDMDPDPCGAQVVIVWGLEREPSGVVSMTRLHETDPS